MIGGRMKDKRLKYAIVQWCIPFTILAVIVTIMLVHFYITNGRKENQEVKDSLIAAAEGYARQFENKLYTMTTASETLADFMENYSSEDMEIAQNVAAAGQENTDAYLVVMCDITGEGVTHEGTLVNIGSADYFLDAVGATQKYTYSSDDGVTGKPCIISAVPIHKGNLIVGFLYSYFDPDEFAGMVKKMEFGVSGYYAVLSDGGGKICEAGAIQEHFAKDDFWGGVLEYASNRKEVEESYNRFQNHQQDVVFVEGRSQSKAIVFAPVGINNWTMVIVMNKEYVDMLQRREWINTQRLMIRLVICIIVFLGVMVVINIISRIRDAEKREALANKADTDLLTGLSNKLATERKIQAYMESHGDQQALMFLLDVDNFKKINDTMGHAFGDEVLSTLGHQLRAQFRASDIVGRIGGDEFMILLKDLKEDAVIQKEAKKLELFFKDFRAGGYVKYSATASIGAAVFPADARDFRGLYKAADKALYKAKQRGKNQLAFFDDSRDLRQN